jgi:hypothetical protein
MTVSATEIREHGAGSIRVISRMRALLADHAATVRPENRDSVLAEIDCLDEVASASFGGSVDESLGRSADRQRIGRPVAEITLDQVSSLAPGFIASAKARSWQ